MSKKITKKDNIKYALSANDAFVGAVEPGEIFEVECAININDGVITHARPAAQARRRAHPVRQRRHRADRGPWRQTRRHADRRGARHEGRGAGLQLALARHRHLSGLGPAPRVRHQDPGGRGQGRHRPLGRPAQAAGPADDRRRRRGAAARRGADRRQRPAWRQSRRPGDHHRQQGDVPRAARRRASVPRRLPRDPGRWRVRRHGRGRDRGRAAHPGRAVARRRRA